MLPEQPYVHQEERCPVADHVLGQLYRASSHGLDELVLTSLPRLVRCSRSIVIGVRICNRLGWR